MIRIKRSILSKITASLFTVVILSLILTGISFSIMIRNFIISETRKNLVEEGQYIAGVLGTLRSVQDIDEVIARRVKMLDTISRNIKVDFAVIDNDNNILYSRHNTSNFNLRFIDSNIIERVRKNNAPESKTIKGIDSFIFAAMPIKDNKGNVKAVLVLYTPINGLRVISFSIFRILAISILISVIIVLIVAYMFAIRISKPINMLKKKTEKISRRDFNITKAVYTGDEIEELDDSFNKMAAEINEYDKSQRNFLQNISHELKTPLTSIQGYAEGIKDGVIEDMDVEKSLNIIIDESQRLKKLVDEIIMLTKLENMEEMYSFSNTSVNRVVKESVDKVKSLIIKKDIDIIVDESEDITCCLDRDRLSQVIINIVGNGVRYARSRIRIEILKYGKEIRIGIENDGKELTDEEKSNIFKRFYKGSNGGQTGLGMAIVHAIIEKHEGRIEIEDSSLGGPKFIIILPCKLYGLSSSK